MRKKVYEQLNETMIQGLQGKSIVFLQAVDGKNQSIYSTALSWVYATDNKTIGFAIDHKSPLLTILADHPKITLNWIGDESTYAITGKATIKEKKAEDISIHLALLQVNVEEVRDIIFFGGKIVEEPGFIKTYDQKLIDQLDQEVSKAVYRALG